MNRNLPLWNEDGRIMTDEQIWGAIVERSGTALVGYAVDLEGMSSNVELELISDAGTVGIFEEIFGDRVQSKTQDENNFSFVIEVFPGEQIDTSNLRVKSIKTGRIFDFIDEKTGIIGITRLIRRNEIACHLICVDNPSSEIRLNVVLDGSVIGTIIASLEKDPFESHLHTNFRVDVTDLLENDDPEQIQLFAPDFDYYIPVWRSTNRLSSQSRRALPEIALEIPSSTDEYSTTVAAKEVEGLPNSEPQGIGSSAGIELAALRAENAHSYKIYNISSNALLGIACFDGYVEGFISRQSNIEKTTISISENNGLIWEGEPRRVGEFNHIPIVGHRVNGFRIELPQPAEWTNERRLKVVVEAGERSEVEFVTNYIDQFIGEITEFTLSDNIILARGWCINKTRPSDPVDLRLRYAAEWLPIKSIKWTRKQSTYSGYDSPNADFEIEAELTAGQRSEGVTVHPARCLEPLPTALSSGPEAAIQAQPGNIDKLLQTEENDVIDGTIDEVSPRFIRGWARNTTKQGAAVILDCLIDGKIYATGSPSRFRADLQNKFGDHGYHEYLFELNPAVLWQRPGQIEIRPRLGENRINLKINRLPHRIAPSRVINAQRVPFPYKREASCSDEAKDFTAAYIVINRNGRGLLKRFFETFLEHESRGQSEVIIVDHNSTDGSDEEVSLWSDKINARFFKRDGNYSFSASNNFAAAQTSADVLVFVNNDVFFHEPTFPSVLSTLSDTQVGCVGIRLLDEIPSGQLVELSAVQHLGIHFRHDAGAGLMAPFESRLSHVWRSETDCPVEVPAVTGAYLACRRQDFTRIGGFDERYFYGMEDVDLCLRFIKAGLRVVSLNNVSAHHLRGFSRASMDKIYNNARIRNKTLFEERFGFWSRMQMAEGRYKRAGYWSSCIPRLAFAVTEATSNTLAGDYFTALELASQLSARFPCECVFLEYSQQNQYDLRDCDVLIAMRDDYDVTKIVNASPHLIKIAWVRNWFERFPDRKSASKFDFIWASSVSSCDFISKKLSKKVELVPIATNWFRFSAGKSSPDYESDYCFTGSYWGLNREIIQSLQPQHLPFRFALFGSGWEVHPTLRPYYRGALPYRQMANVYASTKLVIDDANHVTKSWGGVNSRVFDAIAAGCVVLTNSQAGSDGSFSGKLPVYHSPQELEELIFLYLENESIRLEKVAELQAIVKAQHTYQLRAGQVWNFLNRTHSQLRISIKIGAPSVHNIESWGDYHFAIAMKRRFDILGHTTRIDPIDAWNCSSAAGDHVVIVLRGLTAYQTKPHQINIMWNISHFEKSSVGEFNSYDHVFFASDYATSLMRDQLDVSCSTLLQCTDGDVFSYGAPSPALSSEILFVGNSRGVYRPVVRAALEAEGNVSVFGGGWEAFIPDHVIKGQYIENNLLADFYRSAGVVLNDHWDSMRKYGFISNRLFDAAACGATIITDYVDGMEAIFGKSVFCYSDPAEIPGLIARALAERSKHSDERRKLSERILCEHSFDNRVKVILDKINASVSSRLAAPFSGSYQTFDR
ncbi:glycosyltransferase family protein [Methylobacterium fujisawaense]